MLDAFNKKYEAFMMALEQAFIMFESKQASSSAAYIYLGPPTITNNSISHTRFSHYFKQFTILENF